jgi:DNA polymerase-3 subunit delta
LKLASDSLAAHLQQQLLAAYLVSGDEPLLSGEAADAIRSRARERGYTQREVHFLERGSDWGELRASASNLSLFGSRRLVEIRLPSGKAGTAGNSVLRALIEAADPDRVLLVLTPRLDRDAQSAEWVRAVEARGGWVQIWPVDPGKLVGWLRNRSRLMKLNLTDEALALLAERTEGNLLAAHQELEKLALSGAAGPIGPQSVLASVADSARFDAFKLNESVLAGEADRALRILWSLKVEGTEATLALWALTKAMRELWSTITQPQAGAMRGWQRQAVALEKGARRARSLLFDELTIRAERADRMIKGRLAGDPWDEMALLALEICGRPVLPPAGDVLNP